jgi:polysaccharide export outer membrane protein
MFWDRGSPSLPGQLSTQEEIQGTSQRQSASVATQAVSTSFHDFWQILWRRRRLIAGVEGALLLVCLLYWLFAPNEYEATGRVELRTSPASALSLDSDQPSISSSILSAPIAQETLADVLRSDRLAWRVITGLRLYQTSGFRGRFAAKFPGFDPAKPSPEAQAWLLERFAWRLHVQSMPRTLLVEIRFRSCDAALSAAVVNALIGAYDDEETESQVVATAQASNWLSSQLVELKSRVDRDQQRLAEFEAQHGIVNMPEILSNGQPGATNHTAALLEIDDLSRQLVSATTDRIVAEAELRAASEGDAEAVIASDPRLQGAGSNFSTALLEQIRARRSDLEQEEAQLSAEHGPNFPRVVEIGRQLEDLDRQRQSEDSKLADRFRSNWQTAADREQLLRKSLSESAGEGMKLDQAEAQDLVMRQEANASHDLYMRFLEKSEEAGLAAGVHSSNISVVDDARQPVKPIAPDLPLDLAITFFAGLWIAIGAALLHESLSSAGKGVLVALLAVCMGSTALHAQVPTPSTSGLPTGVASFPQSQETKSLPNPKEAPTVWDGATPINVGTPALAASQTAAPMLAPIAAGDLLVISEYHTPEFRSSVRVSASGFVTLPMIGDVKIAGMNETAAAQAIESVLVKQGMLLHPLISVLVLAYTGQDVSVLGEVARAGVYPYTVHHRLLDLISAASGLSPNAGRLVNIFHEDDPKTPHPVILDPSGTDTSSDHNPELTVGDTVQVSRAGLVYVVGDVIRPGGFPVDPVQGLTIVQALALAWGPSQNAAVGNAILIREEKDGRTMISLDLKRMLRGKDPDQRVQDRDIIFVPDSVAKNLVNRTMESAIQSTIGVSIYSALVYSQRY